MRKFNELTFNEIKALSEEEWKSIPPNEKRRCSGCNYLKGYVSLWCTNKEACKTRGTSIPGIIKCPFWEEEKTLFEKIKNMLK